MKKIYTLLFIACLGLLTFSACQEDEEATQGGEGYLRLNIGANASTKADGEDVYDAETLLVKILNADGGNAVEPFEYDATSGEKKVIKLSPGTYSIQASSAGFDGKSSAYDKPYYAGAATDIVVEKDKETEANVVCTLANVKVTVNFDESFKTSFKTAVATIKSLEDGLADQLVFTMGGTQTTGYFPVVDLSAGIAVVNQSDVSHSQKDEIKDVKARDHYIFNYSVAESGTGSIKINVDAATRTYTYNFAVPTKAELSVTANAWSTFAYLEGTVPAEGTTTIDPSKIEFQYRLASEKDNDEAWQKVEGDITDAGEGIYRITLKGLTANTAYQCRIAYDNESSISSEVEFTTESQASDLDLNLSFDSWHKDGKNLYACTETAYNSGKKFWDSGNEGANTIDENNPTKQETSDVVKGSAARLTSTEVNAYIFNVFAAGSLYSGDFVEAVVGGLRPEDSGAKLSFGQPYTSRPARLTGSYKYIPKNVDYTSSKIPQVKSGDRDSCSIYIALTDWEKPFEVNTQTSTFVDFSSEHIIAYGELKPEEMCPAQDMTAYEEFQIDLKYRDLNRKPTHILIVCSSSKYGDYFVGGVGSTLLVDEFNLEFGEPTIDENYIKQ